MEPQTMFDKIGGRKFVLTIVILLFGSLLEAFGKNGLSANMVALLLGAGGIFGVANAATTIKQLGQPVATEPAPQDETPAQAPPAVGPEHLEAVAGEVEQLRAELETQAEALSTATKLLKVLMQVKQQQ